MPLFSLGASKNDPGQYDRVLRRTDFLVRIDLSWHLKIR